jgi:hypothetical protein
LIHLLTGNKVLIVTTYRMCRKCRWRKCQTKKRERGRKENENDLVWRVRAEKWLQFLYAFLLPWQLREEYRTVFSRDPQQ